MAVEEGVQWPGRGWVRRGGRDGRKSGPSCQRREWRGRADGTAPALPPERLPRGPTGQTLMLFFSREDTDAQSRWQSCPRSQTPGGKREFSSPPAQVSGPSQQGLGLPLLTRKGHDSP